MPDDKSQEQNFDLADFIQRKSELFVVMGVFSALSIYVSQIPPENSDGLSLTGLGVVSSLLLALIIAILIYLQLALEIGNYDGFDGRLKITESPLVTTFFVCLGLLLYSLVGGIFQQEETIISITILLSWMVLIYVLYHTIYYLNYVILNKNWERVVLSATVGYSILKLFSYLRSMPLFNNSLSLSDLSYESPHLIIVFIVTSVSFLAESLGFLLLALSTISGLILISRSLNSMRSNV
ncbi:hypothetical protein [Haloferax sp. AS1]|uniref:hypothetical protein n=1 Tax=Haloferax sp. AS1 TaxID=2562277 RepID=UPI001CB6CA65|nr:hypothetical protein [Haloferax sp. AS1]